MRFRWPADTVFTQRILTVEQETCVLCQRTLAICDHRFHRIFTFQGPLEIVCKLVHCPDRHCPAHAHTLSPLAEAQLTLPWWAIGWDVFCWLGHRRFARHWSIPQLRAELQDTYHIPLSDDALAGYLRRYQTMVAARQQDAAVLANAYREIDSLILTIDGLQPEKGHETLYVVRELRAKRVWFAQALLSSATAEVRRLVTQAKQWAQQLGKPVQLWMSDKQDAFVQAIAAEFPEVPHRYCQNHFVRDVAKPTLEADSHAKVKMRRKVRGLRAIERQVLAQRQTEVAPLPVATATPVASAEPRAAAAARPEDGQGGVVLDYCAAVRGILNDDQGGPLQPPGLRMAAALGEVRESLQRNLDAKKGGVRRSN
jgi:MULE transposase domain